LVHIQQKHRLQCLSKIRFRRSRICWMCGALCWQWRNGKCVYVSVCVCVCVSLQLLSFKLSSGYLFSPHHARSPWHFCLLHRLPQSLSLAFPFWAASQQSPSPPFFTSCSWKKRIFPDFIS
jgi:hypothetical protein